MSDNLRIKEMPSHERPRERLQALGADALSSAELIAILLRTGTAGRNAVEIGHELLRKYERLCWLARASAEELMQVKGIGRDKAVTLSAAFTLARRMTEETQADAPLLDNPDAVANFMREIVRLLDVETFHALMLNTRRRLIRRCEISQGTLDTLLVHARSVFRPAIAANAAAIILVHNHPSGDPSPSEADIKVTRDLARSGHLLGIDVLDHVIMGLAAPDRPRDFVSLKELGYFSGC